MSFGFFLGVVAFAVVTVLACEYMNPGCIRRAVDRLSSLASVRGSISEHFARQIIPKALRLGLTAVIAVVLGVGTHAFLSGTIWANPNSGALLAVLLYLWSVLASPTFGTRELIHWRGMLLPIELSAGPDSRVLPFLESIPFEATRVPIDIPAMEVTSSDDQVVLLDLHLVAEIFSGYRFYRNSGIKLDSPEAAKNLSDLGNSILQSEARWVDQIAQGAARTEARKHAQKYILDGNGDFTFAIERRLNMPDNTWGMSRREQMGITVDIEVTDVRRHPNQEAAYRLQKDLQIAANDEGYKLSGEDAVRAHLANTSKATMTIHDIKGDAVTGLIAGLLNKLGGPQSTSPKTKKKGGSK